MRKDLVDGTTCLTFTIRPCVRMLMSPIILELKWVKHNSRVGFQCV